MNTFGRIFRVSIFGESHGKAIGVVLDGVRSGLPVSESDFMKVFLFLKELRRERKPMNLRYLAECWTASPQARP